MTALFLIVFFAVMLFTGLPLVAAMFIACVLLPIVSGGTVYSFGEITFNALNGLIKNNTGLTIVLFMVAGNVMARGKITEKIFNIFAYFLGKKRGFMPILSIMTCMVYGAISGSGPATCAAVGAMCYPMLVEMGYDRLFSASILVTAGCLGMVIPPSVPLTGAGALSGGMDTAVLYQLGAIAGVTAGILLIIYSFIYCLRHGNGDQKVIDEWVDSLKAMGLGSIFAESIWALLAPIMILVVIFMGWADTAQAAALSLVYSCIISCFVYKTIDLKEIPGVITKAFLSATPILLLCGFADVFSGGMTALQIPARMAATLTAANVSNTVLILMALGIMLLLGTFMDAGGAMMLIVPLFYPLMRELGMDPYPVIVAIIMCQAVGLTTPPFGLCLFTLCPLAKCSVGELGIKVLPMVLLLVAVAVVIGCFPGLTASIWNGAVLP